MNGTAQKHSSLTSAEQDHVQEAFRIAVGLKKNEAHKMHSVPELLQHLFLRSEEYASSERDQWDNWEYAYSDNYQRGKLWTPECDLWIQDQRRRLKAEGTQLAALWPNGHAFAVCLTHDVDYIGETMTLGQRGRELLRHFKARDVMPERKLLGSMKGLAKMFLKHSSLSPRTTNTLEISYLIEKELGVSASYFFTIPPISHTSKYDCLYAVHDKCEFLSKTRKVKDVMSHLVQAGFDVGLHGSYFSATHEGLLQEQKRTLEKAIQTPVHTTRQHWLHMRLPLTLALQEKAGFKADTTLGFNRNIGFRAGTGLPFFAYDRHRQQPLSLIEAPLVIQDGALVGENALEYSPEKALDIAKTFNLRVKECEGCLTYLFHPDIFIKRGLAALYRDIIKHSLDQNAWVTDLNQIQKWWRERAEKLS